MGEYHDTSDTETEEAAQNRRVKGGQGMMSRRQNITQTNHV